MIQHIRHEDSKRDSRYTIRREWTGKPTQQWVVRFCGLWLGSFPTQKEALGLAAKHQEERLSVLAGQLS